MRRKYNLEERINNFSLMIIENSEQIKKTYAGRYLSQQIIRSGISLLLNYSEASVVESRKDIVHKMKMLERIKRNQHWTKVINEFIISERSSDVSKPSQ